MGVEALIAAASLIAGVAGGWFGGRRGLATATVNLLESSVAELREREVDKDKLITEQNQQIANLVARVEVLEALVTQRAEVEEVKHEVQGVRGVVDRIASKVGA